MSEQTMNTEQNQNKGFGNQQPMPPYYQPKKKRRWWIPVLIIAVIFFIIILPIMVVLGLAGSFFEEEPIEVKKNTVLIVNLGEKVDEYAHGNPFEELFGKKSNGFGDILYAIKRAKADDRIKGIYFKASPTIMGYAKNAELIETMEDFRNSGKFIYSFIEMGSESEYYRALPSDKIFMPEEGLLALNGYGIEAMFMKGLFAKLGVDFHVEQMEDYKSAGEMMSRTSFSDSAKKQYRIILNQRHNMFVDAVAKYRKLDKGFINDVLNRGVYTADTLLALGFVDSLMAETDFKDMLKALTNKSKDKDKEKEDKKKLRTISVSDYLDAEYDYDDRKFRSDKRIAIIYGVGAIVDGTDGQMSDEKMITKKMAEYIKKAREDEKIDAIILRVDSPGGSVMASDAIWKEVIKTKGVKPIYSSMSDVAASGGYYISMACDTIIAHPATITGSIGVIASLPNISGTLDKLDITLDTLSTTAASQDLSISYPFNNRQKDKLHSMIEKVYFRFVQKVADGRGMTFDEARGYAKGRVWTGEDAKKIGLVDVLGGLNDAIKLAKTRIGVSEKEKIRVDVYPKKKDPIEALINMIRGGDSDVSLTKTADDYFTAKNSNYAEIYNAMPDNFKYQIDYFRTLIGISRKEPYMYAMPYQPIIQ